MTQIWRTEKPEAEFPSWCLLRMIRSSPQGTFPSSPSLSWDALVLPLLLYPNSTSSAWCAKLGPVSTSMSHPHGPPEADMSLDKYYLSEIIPHKGRRWITVYFCPISRVSLRKQQPAGLDYGHSWWRHHQCCVTMLLSALTLTFGKSKNLNAGTSRKSS